MIATPFDRLADAFREKADAPSRASGFGSRTLNKDGRIFAMARPGHIVFRLPRRRVDALVAGEEGSRFYGPAGKPLNEWVSVKDGSMILDQLASEAYQFVTTR